jgi:hypothetical protein
MAIRNLLRLLVLVSLFAGLLRAQSMPDAPSLLASIDTRNAAIPQFGNSALPPLMPQVLPHKNFHFVSSRTCAAGVASDRECRVHWKPLLEQSLEFVLMQHSARLAMYPDLRANVSHGHWLQNWGASVSNQRITRWSDGDSFTTNYVGHPAMGSVASFLFIQNDPRGRDLTFHNTREYWTSRMRAMAFSAAYTAQWEIGPLSEASLGNTGKSYYRKNGRRTNGTGAADFVVTPLAGAAWSIGEDIVDRELVWRLEGRTNNKAALLAMSLLNPTRSAANLLRGRAPWFRDSRETRIADFALPFHNVAPASAAGE